MSDPSILSANAGDEFPSAVATGVQNPEDERPPACPACSRRFVILATHWSRDDDGHSVRRQLWGCPRGHATAYRHAGIFEPAELLPNVVGSLY